MKMRTRGSEHALMWVITCGVAAGCLNLTLPPQRTGEPGEVSATVLVQRPGRAELQPASGALLELVGSGLQATADADGNVRLAGLMVSSGALRLTWDANSDGAVDASRLFDLQELRAGFGRSVSLGVIVLGRLSSVSGFARRGDRAPGTGHLGIQVFVPSTPSSAITADDGSFVLDGLPEGAVPISFFAPGYAPESNRVSLSAGQSQRLATVTLQPAPVTNDAALVGTVSAAMGPVAGTSVVLDSPAGSLSTVTDQTGAYRFELLPSGLVTLTFRAAGFAPLRVPNLLLLSGSRTQDVTLNPGDADAGLPAGRDAGMTLASGPVTVVSFTQGDELIDGGVAIPPPLLTQEGDLVLVALFRSFPGQALGQSSWRVEVTAPTGNGEVSWLWRRAAADERLRGADYVFMGGTQGSHWALYVLRGASVVSSIGTTGVTGNVLSFPEVAASPGDVVLDVFNEEGFASCASDAGVAIDELLNFHVMRLAVGATGRAPATRWNCVRPNFNIAGYTSQFRVLAAP